MLRYLPELKNKISADHSPDEILFLERLASADGQRINSRALLEIINAYSMIDRSHIPELPLELALIKIIKPEST